MRTVSSALATAIEALGRRPAHQVRVDWDHDGTFAAAPSLDDVSHQVESISITQELTTDLPAEAKLVTGHATSRATVVLGAGTRRDPVEHAAWMYSPFNAESPLAGKERLSAPVVIEQGFVTQHGPERVPTFRGQIRAIDVSSKSRTATLRCLDDRERFREQVTLPVVVADDLSVAGPTSRKPGLTGQWIVDRIARQCGFYATPAPRAHCRLSTTMLGSAWPEIGALVRAANAGGGPVRTHEGFWQQDIFDQALVYNTAFHMSTNDGNNLLFEGRVRIGESNNRVFRATTAIDGPGDPQIALLVVDGHLELHVRRSPTVVHTLVGPNVDVFATQYLGVHVSMTPSQVVVRFRIGAVTATVSTPSVSVLGQQDMWRIHLGAEIMEPTATSPTFQAVQVTTELFTATMWNDGFTPNAELNVSLNNLTGIPVVTERDAWALLQDLAAAEFAIIKLSETGTFQFWNRNWRNRTASATVQRVLTSTTSLLDLGSSESIDTVRNRVIIHAQPVFLTRPGRVWAASEVLTVPPFGTKTMFVDLPGAAYDIDTSVTFSPLGGQAGSGYRATTLPDGGGAHLTNLGFDVQPLGSTAKVVISNPNAERAYLVQPYGYPRTGEPAFSLSGQVVTTEPPEPLVVLGPFGSAWQASTGLTVPPNGTLTLWAPIGTTAYDSIDAEVTFSPLGGQPGSGYRAAQAADGSGGEVSNLSFEVTPFGALTRVIIGNPNGFRVWVVDPVGYPEPGSPALSLWAQTKTTVPVVTGAGAITVVEASDEASRARHGDQPLELPAVQWRQSIDSMQPLADDLVSYMKDPQPTLTNLSIRDDPRVQLCDLVQIVDPAGLAFRGEFHLTSIVRTQSDKATQQISARAVGWGPVPNEYDLDHWDYALYE